jgi:hypothetical protein
MDLSRGFDPAPDPSNTPSNRPQSPGFYGVSGLDGVASISLAGVRPSLLAGAVGE